MKKKLTELSDIRAADKMGSNYLAGVSLPLSLSQLITIDRQTAGIQFFSQGGSNGLLLAASGSTGRQRRSGFSTQ